MTVPQADADRRGCFLQVVLRVQAVFYVITGVWPLLHMRSFERVTGPKTDDWLVHMVGLLAAAIGLALWTGARTTRPAGAIVVLGAASAMSFAAIDLTYALTGRIAPIYLLDAGAEGVLLLALWMGWRRASADSGRGGAHGSNTP